MGLWGVGFGGQPVEHGGDRRDFDPGLGVFDGVFEIAFAETAVSGQPGEGARSLTSRRSLPGVEGAHEKGGVEGGSGRFSRRHPVPVPHVASMAELNDLVAAGDARNDLRRIDRRPCTVGEHFILEAPTLRALPADGFDPSLVLNARVDANPDSG